MKLIVFFSEHFLDLCDVQVCDEEIEDDFSPEDTGPTYFAGPWTGCSVICGDGIKTREVTKSGMNTICLKREEEA